jgi:hypothetical protein
MVTDIPSTQIDDNKDRYTGKPGKKKKSKYKFNNQSVI